MHAAAELPSTVAYRKGKVYASRRGLWEALDRPTATRPLNGSVACQIVMLSHITTFDLGFLSINECMQAAAGPPNIFACGDVATSTVYPRPKAGVFAVRQGPPLTNNIRRFGPHTVTVQGRQMDMMCQFGSMLFSRVELLCSIVCAFVDMATSRVCQGCQNSSALHEIWL